ncbi:MAG: hypothetical protein AB7V46_17530 [Thermomicrobiales bacterium]
MRAIALFAATPVFAVFVGLAAFRVTRSILAHIAAAILVLVAAGAVATFVPLLTGS